MKILKRIFFISLAILLIASIVCTSVLAANGVPSYDNTQLKIALTPYSNLESMLVRVSGSGTADYSNFYSPYSFVDDTEFDEIDGTTYSFNNAIGQYRSDSGSITYFRVAHDYEVNNISAGVYYKQDVSFTTLNGKVLDMKLFYGQSALPLSGYDTSMITDVSNPFFSTYSFTLKDTLNSGGDLKVDIKFRAKVLSFDYRFVDSDDKYYTLSDYGYVDLTFDYYFSAPQDSNGEANFEFNLYDVIMHADRIGAIDLDSLTIDSTMYPTDFPYLVFEKLELSLYADYVSDDGDGANDDISVSGFTLTDYTFQSLRNKEQWILYPPLIDSAMDFLNRYYPVYVVPPSASALDFNDFLFNVASIFDVNLFGTFSLGDLLFGVVGIGALIWFLKMFAGG